MQSMIILAASFCLAQASFYPGPPAHIQLSPDGKYVLDTPEVAHAKASHLAAHAQASSAHGAWAPAGPAYIAGPAYGDGGHYGAPGAGLHKYGPAPLAHDGRVVDTPEVAHLKAAHIAAHSAEAAKAAHGGYAGAGAGLGAGYGAGYGAAAAYGAGYAGGYGKWSGPQAHIQLTHDGQYVVDTPEVQHARAAHFHQFAAAAQAAAAAPEDHWEGHGAHGWH
ncbi:pupal cuticle protein-like [Vanessa atalanta]|uniref:pupal cuticle protein-like n=1 Tax=Vanessa atalanta TaxID=42275 RepID=UPI001FCCDC96|nr:pupal cuticle protein-like [Vanessa atalanta]